MLYCDVSPLYKWPLFMKTNETLPHLSPAQEWPEDELKKALREQMVKDLEKLLVPYKNKDIGLRILSTKTLISEKTLKRMIKTESDPHGLTLQRFYEYFFKAFSEEEFLGPIHQYIRNELAKTFVNKKQKVHEDLEKELRDNKVFRDIFLVSRTGPISKDWIIAQYGLFGMEIVKKMLKDDLLIECEKNIFTEGTLSISKGSDTLKMIILDLISTHLNTQKLQEYGNNMAFYVMEGINELAVEEVLKQTEEYKKNVAAIILNVKNKGNQRIFVTTAVDLIQINESKGKLH